MTKKIQNQPFDFQIIDWNGSQDQVSFQEVAEMLGFEVEDGSDPKPPTQYPPAPEGYQLAFYEDFHHPVVIHDGQDKTRHGAWIDSFARWGVRTLDGNEDKGTKQFIDGVTHALNRSGNLVLSAGADPMVDNGFYAGMLSSERLYTQLFGYWETRMRVLNMPDGYHFAAWLLRQDGEYAPKQGTPSEIDLIEIVQGNGQSSESGYFNDHPSDLGISRVALDTSQWFTVGVKLTPEGVEFFLDGKLVRASPMVYADPMYFLMTWEVDSKWPGRVVDKSQVAKIEVDYVAAFRPTPQGETVSTI